MSVRFDRGIKSINVSNDLQLNTNNITLKKEYDPNSYDRDDENSKNELGLLIDSDNSVSGNISDNEDNNDFNQNSFDDNDGNNDDFQQNIMSFEETQTRKAYYLGEIERLSKNGVKPYINLDMSNDLNEITGEYHRMKHYYETEIGIRRMRSMMMYSVNLLETFDSSYNLIGDLDGFSMHTQANILEYDDIFAELYNKYKDKVSMGPELRLLIAFGGSLAQFKSQKKLTNALREEQEQQFQSKINSFRQQEARGQKMKGPSMTTDERLRQFGLDDDNISEISGLSSTNSNESLGNEDITFIEPIAKEEKKTKRGRPKKNQK